MPSCSDAIEVVACVIVRMKSTRLARKALRDIEGQPLLVRLVNRLKQAKYIDRIVVCTSRHPDDGILCEVATDLDIDALRGSEIDVLERMEKAAARFDADLVLRVTGDNVFTDPTYIDRMIDRHVATGAEYTRTNGLPLGATAEVLSTSILPRLREAIPDPRHSEYMMLYAFDPDRFRCQVLEADQEERRPFYSVTVDTPEDLQVVRDFYGSRTCDILEPGIREVVSWLDQAPEYAEIHPETEIKLPGGASTTYGEFLKSMEQKAARAAELHASEDA